MNYGAYYETLSLFVYIHVCMFVLLSLLCMYLSVYILCVYITYLCIYVVCIMYITYYGLSFLVSGITLVYKLLNFVTSQSKKNS